MSHEINQDKRILIRPHYEKYEKIIDYLNSAFDIGNQPIIISVPEKPEKKEQESLATTQQLMELNTEVQTLKNQLNKYLKVDIREESARMFSSLISQIEEINEVYAQHNGNGIIFWIIYDKGDRLEILEKVVDIECSFERIFNNLDFDYRIISVSSKPPRIQATSELIYLRK